MRALNDWLAGQATEREATEAAFREAFEPDMLSKGNESEVLGTDWLKESEKVLFPSAPISDFMEQADAAVGAMTPSSPSALAGSIGGDLITKVAETVTSVAGKTAQGIGNTWSSLDADAKKKIMIAGASLAAVPLAWQGVKGLSRGLGYNAGKGGEGSEGSTNQSPSAFQSNDVQTSDGDPFTAFVDIPSSAIYRWIQNGKGIVERSRYSSLMGVTLANDPASLLLASVPSHYMTGDGYLLSDPSLHAYLAGGLWDKIKSVGKGVLKGVSGLANSGLGKLALSFVPGGAAISKGLSLASGLVKSGSQRPIAVAPAASAVTHAIESSPAIAAASTHALQQGTSAGSVDLDPITASDLDLVTPTTSTDTEAAIRFKKLAAHSALASARLGGDPLNAGSKADAISRAATKVTLELAKAGADYAAAQTATPEARTKLLMFSNSRMVVAPDAIPELAANEVLNMAVSGADRALQGDPILAGAYAGIAAGAVRMLPTALRHLKSLAKLGPRALKATAGRQSLVMRQGLGPKAVIGGTAVAYFVGRADAATNSDARDMVDSNTLALVLASLSPGQAAELIPYLAAVKQGRSLSSKERARLESLIMASIVSAQARVTEGTGTEADVDLIEEMAKIAGAADVPSAEMSVMATQIAGQLLDPSALSVAAQNPSMMAALSVAGDDISDESFSMMLSDPRVANAVAEGDSDKLKQVLAAVGIGAAGSLAAAGAVLGAKSLKKKWDQASDDPESYVSGVRRFIARISPFAASKTSTDE